MMADEKGKNMFDEEGVKIGCRYTVCYEGYLFVGDSDGLNIHYYDRWDEVQSLMRAYPDIIEVHDNEYGVTWQGGEWY